MNSKTIIIIDDDSDDLDMMKKALTRIDSTFLCISFLYADEAVRLLTKEFILRPDYIFIDINMPRMTGPQCLQALRAVDQLNDAVITMHSTNMPVDQSKRLIEKGADHTFQKPASQQELLAILEAIIFKTGAHKGLKSRNQK